MQTGPTYRWRRIATPLALAVVSLAAAVALWVVVTEAENPNKVEVFSGSIEVRAVNVPDGLAVASIRDPVVNLRISAPEDTLRRLTAADFRAEVDMSGQRQSTSDQRVIGRVIGNRDVEIVGVEPAVVTVNMEPLTSKTVPVQANPVGSVPQGFTAGDAEINPAQVRVTGAESLVRLVSFAAADVNLTGLRVSLRQQYQLVAKDARGAEVRGVRLDPGTSDIKVAVNQQEITLPVTVVPSAQGIAADGYNVIGLSSDPPVIPLAGPLEILERAALDLDRAGGRDRPQGRHHQAGASAPAGRHTVAARFGHGPHPRGAGAGRDQHHRHGPAVEHAGGAQTGLPDAKRDPAPFGRAADAAGTDFGDGQGDGKPGRPDRGGARPEAHDKRAGGRTGGSVRPAADHGVTATMSETERTQSRRDGRRANPSSHW